MASRFKQVLIDARSGIYLPRWRMDADNLPGGRRDDCRWRVTKNVLVGGRQHGVDLLRVDNGRLAFDVVPTRGLGIQEAIFEGIRLGWDSPVCEVVHPAHIDHEELGGLGWLRGFSEWFVRCGLTSVGAPCRDRVKDNQGRSVECHRTLHGGVANTPASYLAVEIETAPPYAIEVHGCVREARMFGENLLLETVIRTLPGSNALTVEDRVTNLRAVPDQAQVLYHINYGPPLLEEGSRLLLAADLVMPREPYERSGVRLYRRYRAPRAGRDEQCFFTVPRADRKGRCLHALVNAAGDLAVSHAYELRSLPCFTLWKNEAADGYVTGLEPGTSYPNPVPFEREQGRVLRLRPGAVWSAAITLSVHVGRKEVGKVSRRVRSLQGRKQPRLLYAPTAAYAPGA